MCAVCVCVCDRLSLSPSPLPCPCVQVLEQVNGTLAAQYPDSVQYRPPDAADDSTAPAAASSSPDCPYWLVKFDMAESRCVCIRASVCGRMCVGMPECVFVAVCACELCMLTVCAPMCRFLVKRFNVQTLPCFLAFCNGRLVYAGVMVRLSVVSLRARC